MNMVDTILMEPQNQKILIQIKSMLVNRIFLGFFRERKLVNAISCYRDVVVVSPGEAELLQVLNLLRKKLKEKCNIRWIGITFPETQSTANDYCFWCNTSNITFGQYWFLIRSILVSQNELCLELKDLRPVHPQDFLLSQDPSSSLKTDNILNKIDFKNLIENAQEYCTLNLNQFLTQDNLISFFKMLLLCLVVMYSVIVSFILNLGEYTLKLSSMAVKLVVALTPIVIHVIDFFSKIVGGIFIIVALIFSNSRNPNNFQNFQQRPRPVPQLQYRPYH